MAEPSLLGKLEALLALPAPLSGLHAKRLLALATDLLVT